MRKLAPQSALVSFVRAHVINAKGNRRSHPKMSTTAISEGAPSASATRHQQPVLASQRAQAQQQQQQQQAERDQTSRRTGPMAAYFPLGYKEAAHQWVSLGFCILTQQFRLVDSTFHMAFHDRLKLKECVIHEPVGQSDLIL